MESDGVYELLLDGQPGSGDEQRGLTFMAVRLVRGDIVGTRIWRPSTDFPVRASSCHEDSLCRAQRIFVSPNWPARPDSVARAEEAG